MRKLPLRLLIAATLGAGAAHAPWPPTSSPSIARPWCPTPQYASARASYLAGQEKIAQGKAGLLPQLSANANLNYTNSDANFPGSPLFRGGQRDWGGRSLRRAIDAAAVSAAEPRDLRTGQAAGAHFRDPADRRRPGPDGAREPGVFRRAARPGQSRFHPRAEDRHQRTARPGQAQFRRRHRDHHRYQRCAGALSTSPPRRKWVR